MGIDQPRRSTRSATRDAWIAISRVADQGEIVGNELWIDTKFLAHSCFVTNDVSPSVDLHDVIVHHTLSEILVWSPNADLFHTVIKTRKIGSRSKCVVGFELDHRPCSHAHCKQRLFERMKLS